MTTDAKKVDAYIKKHEKWADILQSARKILLAANMEETVKWGTPTYTVDGKNVIGLAGFKNHCGIWFHNGVFLKDPDKQLVNAQEGTTRGLRQWRLEEGDKLPAAVFKKYVKEAIANQLAGKEIKPKQPAQKKTLKIPAELEAALQQSSKLKKAFDSLTPGKQKEYAEHIGSAKQEKTRLSRLDKAKPQILAGAGLYDKYKNC